MINLKNTNNSFNLRLLSYLTVFGCLFFGSLTTVYGQLVTFAQFSQKNATQDYVFTNNTTNAAFNTVNGGSPIDFKYLGITGLDPSLQGFQDAHLFLLSGTNAPATLSNNTLTQLVNNTGNTISIIRDTPAAFGTGNGMRTNLLTITFSPIVSVAPSVSGTAGGNSASFSATTPDHTVVFTSDFLDFSSSTQRNFALSFSSVLPALSSGAGGFLNTFAAAGSGTFASNPKPFVVTVVTAANVTISGRVLTPSGRGLRNALVTITEANGSTRTILTGNYGSFSFADLEIPQTIVLRVRSKSYRYAPQIISPGSDLSDVNFIPEK